MKIPDDVREILKDSATVKMISTVDTYLDISLERVKHVEILDDDIILLPYFNKKNHTLKNIQQNSAISLAVLRPPIIAFKLNGTLRQIDETGKYLKYFDTLHTGQVISGVIKIKISEIYALTMAISGDKIA